MFALSALVFVAYQFDGGSGLRYELQWDWLENIGFLGENGITLTSASTASRAPLVLLNGIVIFAGVFVSWNITHRHEGLLHPAVPARGRRLRRLHLAGPVLLLLLLRGRGAADVPADRRLGCQQQLRHLHAHQGIRRDEADADAGRGLRAHLHRHLRRRSSRRALGTFDMPTLRRRRSTTRTSRSGVFPFFMVGFGVLAGMWPFHTWSPDGHVAAPTARLDAARRRADEARRVRHPAPRHHAAAGGRRVLGAGADDAGRHRRALRRDLRARADGPQVHGRLLQRQPHGLRADGPRDR